jgi:hypothetical protein
MSSDPTQHLPISEGDPQPTPSYYGAPPPQGPPLTDPSVPAPKPKMSKGKKWGIGVGAVVAIGIIANLGNKAPDTGPTAAPIVAASSAVAPTPSVDPSVQASVDAVWSLTRPPRVPAAGRRPRSPGRLGRGRATSSVRTPQACRSRGHAGGCR